MEHEFNNRISAQRNILRAINKTSWPSEGLFGLSSKAIDRWVTANRLDSNSTLVEIVKDVSSKLFFLANKSQDQVSEQYQIIRSEIMSACHAIQNELK